MLALLDFVYGLTTTFKACFLFKSLNTSSLVYITIEWHSPLHQLFSCSRFSKTRLFENFVPDYHDTHFYVKVLIGFIQIYAVGVITGCRAWLGKNRAWHFWSDWASWLLKLQKNWLCDTVLVVRMKKIGHAPPGVHFWSIGLKVHTLGSRWWLK